jgi:hypothetical protein
MGGGAAREIPLSQGQVALVDEADYPRVVEHRWYVRNQHGRHYVATHVAGHRNAVVLLHRFLLAPPPGLHVDHIDGNPLNNTRANLRFCSNAENARNRAKNRRGRHPYKGIACVKGRWTAQLACDGLRYYKCGFKTPEEAASAYDALARQHHGAFARLNFPAGGDDPRVGSALDALDPEPSRVSRSVLEAIGEALKAGLSVDEIARLTDLDEALVLSGRGIPLPLRMATSPHCGEG